MLVRDTLAGLVALAIVGLLVLVVTQAPPYAPAATIGTLPLGKGSFALGMSGTYYAPCTGQSEPIRWAAFLLQTNSSNASFRVAGSWTSTRPSNVSFGLSANLTSQADLAIWNPVGHCPIGTPGSPPPAAPLPPLATSGSIDSTLTTLPGATLFILEFRTFDRDDIINITQPFTVTPI